MDRPSAILAASLGVAGAALALNQLLKTVLRLRAAAAAAARPALWAPPPHPGWRPPQPQPAPFVAGEAIEVDPASLPPGHIYPLIISAVVPRPVAFVSTVGSSGGRYCVCRAGRAACAREHS